MKKLILISGKINTGKNQLSKYLKSEFKSKNLNVECDMFAKGVKDGCKEDFKSLTNIFNKLSDDLSNIVYLHNVYNKISQNDVKHLEKCIKSLKIHDNNWYEDKTDITRTILQIYGTDIFRKKVDENWWVKQLRQRVIKSNADIILCSDVRFPNEITGITENCLDDGYETVTIRITRTINTDRQIADHDSETALDNWTDWDYVVENEKTLQNLKKSAKTVVEDLLNETYNDVGLFTRNTNEELQTLTQII